MDDLISRQAAIAYAVSGRTREFESEKWIRVSEVRASLQTMPSVQPEQRTGRWLDTYNDGDWHCSECGAIVEKDEQIRHYWQRCYHCGAKMGGERDERY